MSVFQLPVKAIPQNFSITLANKEYSVTSRWNDAPDGGWIIDFVDATTGLAVASNIPMIAGADMLSGLEYLGFEGQLRIFTDGDSFAVPTYTNLGVECNLYFNSEVD